MKRKILLVGLILGVCATAQSYFKHVADHVHRTTKDWIVLALGYIVINTAFIFILYFISEYLKKRRQK